MKIHHYHPATKEYLGSGEADANPLEQGKYLVPANATTEQPNSDIPEDHVNIYTGEWIVELDLRGTTYWLPDGSKGQIVNIGEPLPDGATTTEPEAPEVPEEKPQSCTPRQARLALNELGERDIVESAVAASSRDVQDSWEYSTVYKRTDPMIIMLSSGLGWGDDKIDELFALAITK